MSPFVDFIDHIATSILFTLHFHIITVPELLLPLNLFDLLLKSISIIYLAIDAFLMTQNRLD